MLVLDSNEYWFEITKADNPKQAFEFMIEQIKCWDEFNSTTSFIPKRYSILSNPETPLNDKDISSYVESIGNKKIRNNYVACLFLKNNRFFLYRKKNNVS